MKGHVCPRSIDLWPRGMVNAERWLFRMDELKIFCKVGIVPLTSLSKDSILLLELGCLYQIVTVYSLMEPLSP